MNEIVEALRRSPTDRATLCLAAAAIGRGEGKLLFEVLFGSLKSADPGSEEIPAIAAMMPMLETMWLADPSVAGYLMARLLPVAARRPIHAVADAIHLHLEASASEELATVLSNLATEGVSPRLQTHCLAWAAAIRRNRARAR